MKKITQDLSTKGLESSRAVSRVFAIHEGWTARLIFNLTSNAFFAGLLKFMGASDANCGKIMAIPVLAGFVQFLSPLFIERLKWKKTLITIGATIHRFLLSFMILVAILPLDDKSKLWIIAIVYFISHLSIAFVNPAISNMIITFVPRHIRGSYFGKRESYILLFSTIGTLVLGKILDIYKFNGHQYTGYIIVYLFVFLNTVFNITAITKMNEVRIKPSRERYKLKDVIVKPLADRNFRKIIILFILFSAGLQVGGAFFGVYMVSGLNMSYTFITVVGMVSSLCYFTATRFWGKMADRSSWSRVTIFSLGTLGVGHVLWGLIFKEAFYFYALIVIVHMLGGTAWAGINIALFNIQFDFTPEEGRTLYIGFNAALSGIVGYTAAFIGSELVQKYEELKLSFFSIPISIIQIVLSLSGVLILICTLYFSIAIRKSKESKT